MTGGAARWFAAQLRTERRGLAGVLAWSVAAALPALVSGRLIALAVDQGFLRGRGTVGLAWLGALAAATAVGALGARQIPRALGGALEPVRDRIVPRIVDGALRGALARRPDPGVVAKLTEQTETVRDTGAGLLLGMQQVGMAVVAAAIGLLLLAPVTALLVLPPVLAALLLLSRLLPELMARHRALLAAEDRVAATVGGLTAAVRDVVACGAGPRAGAEAAAVFAEQAAAERAVARAAALRTELGMVGGQLSLVVLLAAAPWLVASGRLSPGEVLGALTYVTTGLQPALRAAVQSTGGSGVRLAVTLQRLLDGSADEPDPAPAGGRVPGRLDLSVEGLTFAYGAGAEPVVRDLDLTVPHGTHLAVVGPSGIGKSTLADLLTGVAVPQAGRVRVGGVPLAETDPAWRRRSVAIIPQEAYVFSGTLAENLAYLRPDAAEAELDAAVAALGLAPLRARLGGYGAALGPRSGLTPGERQLVALARVWLSPARIVVLDEATCHLDPAAEARVEHAFRDRPGTLVVIAHRLSSARRADRVLVMDGTRPRLGTHGELLRDSPLYADLVGAWTVHPAAR
ncbi:ABC transporter ATP-binding protein [Actinomadura kijaniata]|uniref:ATP-binding cassette domain-containing protein n=1 Tax=Actinomadura kijaniata TaxID=46161 RepID=UPI002FE8D59B